MMDPSSSSSSSPSITTSSTTTIPAPSISITTPSTIATTTTPASSISATLTNLSRQYQHLLDRSTPHVGHRWLIFAAVFLIYTLRVWLVQGFYIVTYALGIYVLNLLIAFLSPQVDPEIASIVAVSGDDDGPQLPTRASDEFRPFVRRLPEFKFWYSITKAFCIGFVLTFFSVFDVPVFWPILLFYWLVLFTVTMKRQILHMIKYRYVPFSHSSGKQRYNGKRAASSDDLTLPNDSGPSL